MSESIEIKSQALYLRLSNCVELSLLQFAFREKIGVFSCGPKSLNAELARICCQGTINRTVFEFYHESL